MQSIFKRTASCKMECLFFNIKNESFKTFYNNYEKVPISFISKRKHKLYRNESYNSLNSLIIQGGRRFYTSALKPVISVHIDKK